MHFSSVPSPNPPPAPPKPPITWAIPPLPRAVYHQWHDGSVKVTFPADMAEQVVDHFRQLVKSMEIANHMLKHPPKKCPGCRGKGQIIVKNGDHRHEQVCPSCNGSGSKIDMPKIPTDPSTLMTRSTGHASPLPGDAKVLPHQTYVPEQIRNDSNPKITEPAQEPAPVDTGLREVNVSELEDFDDS